MVTMANKSQVVTDMSRYIIRDEARSSLEDFVKGLDILGFVAFTKENPGVMYHLLCGKDQKKLGANELYDLFTIEFSGAAESMLRAKEEETNQYFLCFMMELEGGDVVLENGYKPTLEDLLSFVTGCRSVPPGGFPKQPFVYFTGVRCMARASTCDLSLTLPVHMVTYQSFLEMMQECVATSGFGQI